ARIAGAAQLKRKVDAAQNIYDRLKALVDSVSINRSIDQENLEILQNAGPAQRSYSKEAGLMAMSGLGGFAVGVLIIALITFRDDQFTSLNEISEKLGQSVLGQVPLIPNAERNAPLPLLEMNDQRHAYAESYRSLRSALHFLTVDGQKPRVILMTSAMPHEGKSTVSANLARTLALSGSKVILIDADLRRGMLNKLLGMQRAPGLSDLLSQPGITLEQVIQRDPVINFAFIASGKLISNSADILLGPAFDKLVATLREQYDYVLVDSSPVFATDDSTTLAPRVDGVLFVVRNRFSRMGPSKEALDLLYQRQARVLGVVYNQVDASARSYYYYKYDEYNYTAEET
ncbi:MAG TPA: CpsD/CapB family tyrosine-protein kinase, partial [Dongiaceae bacterium]|nr:CpsD/CapB family tyrosine-protein kinase [Dongiaceae bacterium]